VRRLFTIVVASVATVAAAEVESQWQQYPSFYRRNYVLVGGARTGPQDKTRHSFDSGKVLPSFAYRYYLSTTWFSGIGGGYMHMIEQRKPISVDGRIELRDTSFALGRIYLENSYLLRLYHPAYLSLGFRIFYLYPLQPPLLPTSRHHGYNREFGASAVAALNLFPSDEVGIHLVAERWRGVNSSRLHGFEFSLLVGYRL
jgi:hypothetical protein